MRLQVQQLLFPGIPSAKGSGIMPMERTFKVFTGLCSCASCPGSLHSTSHYPSSLWSSLIADRRYTA